ncbi:MFS transporter [Tepidibacillus fermentans]|uniref:Putative MFS family arabinose efflux permease n=1 Tax=Tepidibacillus fermentans TaxID=1281767 RepID=A0A4R3KLP0_9BACI|nr:MFS transporter [Tepidibacillus fermentans]TCS84510.1 putative MFS family arabinose efflux permease [Tepidibacillus fermentans]
MGENRTLDYYIIAIISAFFMIGIGGTRPLISLVLANELNASTWQIGFIVSLYSFFPLFFAIKMGKWVDRVGSKKPLLISTFFGSIALMIPAFSPTIGGVGLSQLLSGISQTILAVSAQSYAGNTKDPRKREINIAIFSIGVSVGSLLGPLLGGLFSDRFGYFRAFFYLANLGLISSLFTLILRENRITSSHSPDSLKGNIFELLTIPNVRKAFFISSLILIGKDIFGTYFPLIATKSEISNTMIGFIIALNAGAGIFIRWVLPILLDRFTRNQVIVGSILISGITFLLFPLFNNLLLLTLLSLILGMGLGIGQPLSITTTILSLPEDRVGEGLGLRLTSNRLTQVLGPILFGIFANLLGFASVFLITGVFLIVGSVKAKVDVPFTDEKEN